MQHEIDIIPVEKEQFEEVEWYFDKHYDQLSHYADQIVWWNNKINLVSRNTSKNIVLEHIRHSLTPVILSEFWECRHFIDAGTGGGLPGVPLSIAFNEAEYRHIDINQKKISALKQILYNIKLDAESALAEDIYTFEPANSSIFISKHAFKLSILNDIKDKNYSQFIFLKGSDFKDELFHVKHPLKINAYKLDSGTDLSFYKNKYLLHINIIQNG
jgi:16S rRNA (guanine527-N7)-methyltransferase